MPVRVTVTRGPLPPADARWLQTHLHRIAPLAGATAGSIHAMVVDDARMSLLHQQFMNIKGTTDVLTFDLREPSGKPAKTGRVEVDLALCLDEAARQAKARGHQVRLELLLYAVHGLLHVLGYDDHAPDQAVAMHRREDELLRAVGLPAAYGGSDRPRKRG